VTDVERGTARTLTTDTAGAYAAPNLIPGTYNVRVEFQGFRTCEPAGIVLSAAAGEEIIIGKAGKPIACLVPYRKVPPKREPGSMKGKIRIARDFDELPDDVLASFQGERP
jgi:antitoxin (DNA-binding transcriptional repressor) of toxin-antitoxin stability system